MVTAKRVAAVFVAAMTTMAGGSAAHARLITFQFAGVIDSVDDPDNVLEDGVQPGNPFSGSYTFESTAPDSRPNDPQLGLYGPPGPAISFRIDTLDILVIEDNSRIAVGNVVASSNPRDSYVVGALLPFSNGNFSVLEIGLILGDDQGSVFTDDNLPISPPDLGAFETRQFRMQGNKGGARDFLVFGQVTMLVPEPESLTFLLVGLALMTRRRHD